MAAVRKKDKLNKLQYILPEPLLASVPWLESQGYSRSLLSRYAAAGWLVQPTPGIYHRPGFRPCWQGAITSLQSLLGYPLVVGGKTALEVYYRNISPSIPQLVHLYGPKAPPGWLHKLGLENKFLFHRTKRLFPDDEYSPTRQQFGNWDSARQRFSMPPVLPKHTMKLEWNEKEMPMIISATVRAVLEHLDEIPGRERLDDAGNVMRELALFLNPPIIQEVLCQCRSVKVKRLFLWFGERHGQPWFGRIDVNKIDLGSGKRVLFKEGGCLDRKYQITYPSYMEPPKDGASPFSVGASWRFSDSGDGSMREKRLKNAE